MNPRLRVILFLSAVTAVSGTQVVWGQLRGGPGDWPGWRGPDRTGLSTETGLLKQWPKEGPKLVWKVTGLGAGYSTPSVANGRLYVMGAKGKTEEVICLDVKDGKRIWSAAAGPMAPGGRYPAPRSTPTLTDDRLYALNSSGRLVCLDITNGKLIWSKDLPGDFGGRHGNWAYAESVLVDGDRVVCTPGGDRATVVCLDRGTGKEIWRSAVKAKMKEGGGGGGGRGKGMGRGKGGYTTAGYSSPVVAELAGVKQYVHFIAGGVVGVSAKDGKQLWTYDWSPRSNANAVTPIIRDNSVLVASGYGVGAGRATILPDGDGFKAKELYFVSGLQTHHGGLVLVGDHLYGTGSSALMCVSFKDGKVAWTVRGVGKGSVAYADGHIYHRGENGDVALVEATPSEYKEKGRFRQPDRSAQRAWPYPVIAGGKLYLRDWDVLLCYDVKAN